MAISNKNPFIVALKTLLIFILLAAFILPQNSYADGSTGPGRTRSCNATGAPEGLVNGLFPIENFGDSRDLVFDMSNPVCVAIATSSYVAVKLAINYMNTSCGNSSVNRYAPSPILDTIDIAKCTKNNASHPTPTCTAAIAAAFASVGTFIGILQIVYDIAEPVYDNAKVCGSNWTKPNPDRYDRSTPDHLEDVNTAVQGYIDNDQSENLSFDNKTFREWYYGGVEVEDNPYGYSINNIPTDIDVTFSDDSDFFVNGSSETADYYFGVKPCLDPAGVSNRTDTNYPRQRYYMRGSQTANFNCKRYQVFDGQKDPVGGGDFKDADGKRRLKDFK
ncbi:MAG: hypothetical protein KGQ36_01800, partial [Rickettsiales bacterium]|nr:hypothetical protein [Rickettsiales bacterium]